MIFENSGIPATPLALKDKLIRCFLFVILLAYLIIESSNSGDFHIFLSASADLFKGENIYVKKYFDGFHYFYSILFAIVIYPLTLIPVHLATFLWLCFNVVLIYRLYKLIPLLLPLNQLTKRQQTLFWIITAAFSFRLVFENLHVGQMTIFLLFLCIEGLYRIFHHKKITGAVLIAIGINIKLLPIVLIPYLLYRKEFKAAILVILFYVLFLYLPVLFIGLKQTQVLLTTWSHLINPLNTNHILDVEERSFHGLSTLLSTLLVKNVPDTFALSIKRNIADVTLDQLASILMIVRLTLITFMFYFMQTFPFKHAINSTYRFREISYMLLLIPLIFPHQQHYAFLFIAPAYMYCTFYMMTHYTKILPLKRNLLIALMVLIFITTDLKIILGQYNHYYEHFKILTYGALLLIIPLALFKPEKQL